MNISVYCRCKQEEIIQSNIILPSGKILKDALKKCKCKSSNIEYMEKIFDIHDPLKKYNTLLVAQNGNLEVYKNDKRIE